MNGGFAIFHAHVHMQAENQIGAGHQLHVFHHAVIALIGINLLGAPISKRMGSAGGEQQSIFARQSDHLAAQLDDLRLGVLDVLADSGADFHHRLVHLRLDALFHAELALGDDLGMNVRAQVARDRINGLVLFFNPDSEAGTGHYFFAARTVTLAAGGGGDFLTVTSETSSLPFKNSDQRYS